MGARPSSFTGGGGGMFTGDFTITGYEFQVGNTVTIQKGPRKGEPRGWVPPWAASVMSSGRCGWIFGICITE